MISLLSAFPSTADHSLNDLEKSTQYHVTSSLLSPMVTWMEKVAFLIGLVYSARLLIIWLSGLPCFHFLFVSVWRPFYYGKQAFCIPGLNGWAGAVLAREWVSEHVVLKKDINSVFSSPPFVCYIKKHFACRCFQASFKKYHYYPLFCSPPQSCICLFVLCVYSFLWCILLWYVVLKKMFLFCVNYVCVVVCLESGWERKGAPKKGCCKKKLLVLQKPCMMGKECSLSQGVSYRTVGLDTTVHTLQHAVWYAGYSTRGRLGVSSTFSL